MYDRNFSIKENIEREVQRARVSNVKKFLKNMIQLENANERVLLISEPLLAADGWHWRVVVRPLGISILTESSVVQSYNS